MNDPSGPAMVLGLVLLEISVGSMIALAAASLWGKVRWGFYKLVGATVVVAHLLGLLSIMGPLGGPFRPLQASLAVGLSAGALTGFISWQLLVYLKRYETSKYPAIIASVFGLAGLVAVGFHPATSANSVLAVAQILAGTFFMGGVVAGLLLGHWHLVDRRLSSEPISRLNNFWLIGGSAVVVTVLAGLGTPAEVNPEISPLLGAGELVVWLSAGLGVLCLVIGGFVRALIKEGSIQSATGLFYLGVIMAFASEFAAKVRFF